MMGDILVVKLEDYILISQNGKRLIIGKDHIYFNNLKDKSIKEIKDWYLVRQL